MTEPIILVIGERFIDRYYVGTASRLSPEAPVPVVKIDQTFELPGGAANVSANLRALGCEPTEIYQWGAAPIKNRLISSGIQVARWDEHDDIKPWDEYMFRTLGHHAEGVDGVIISDYNKGAFTPENTKSLFAAVAAVPFIFVDSKSSPTRFGLRPNETFYFPNMKEYREHASDYESCPNIVRTMSEAGMELLHNGQELYHEPAYAKRVVSVSGAGDTAIAAFAYEYCRTLDPERSLRFASKACAVSVGKPYTSTATHDEIDKIT